MKRILAIVLFVLSFATADVQPMVPTSQAVAESDVIVVGHFAPETGPHATSLQARLEVSESIKGGSPSTLMVAVPATREGGLNLAAIQNTSPRIYFLKQARSGFEFANPYFHSLPAPLSHCAPDGPDDALSRVITAMLSVLCADNDIDDKVQTVQELGRERDPRILPALRQLIPVPTAVPPSLRVMVLAILARHGDHSVLPAIEHELSARQEEDYRAGGAHIHVPRSNLLYALRDLKDPDVAIPIIAHAFESNDEELRGNAARALDGIETDSSIDALLAHLDDPSYGVQFAIMQALGDITRQHEWRPRTAADPSDQNWSACLDHWHEFARKRKTH